MTIARAETLASKLGSGRLLLGGHRGNPDECPENTLASFRSAIELGVDLIECDVHRSEDGGLPVIHDHLLDRTTNGSGLVRDHTMAELKRFDAGRWKDARFEGERIPSLDDVLALAKGHIGVAIEIKNLPLPYAGIEEAVVDALRRAEMVRDVVVISFDHRCIKRIGELEPEILTGILEASRPVDILRVMDDAAADVFCPHWASIEPDTAAELHAAAKMIGVWTVDDVVSLAWSKALPANAIYTNKPREIRP
ncbi:MAG: glycerophosphodiester phosphodiesterase [Chloroflexi bacterium]|nr:MAG: glycerophosphodiester phosphodiesterase [Chloroflexota bacterium]